MTIEEARKLRNGVYTVWWTSGGSSVASVGRLHSGKPWFAPANWVSEKEGGTVSTKWRDVKKVTLIKVSKT